MVAKQKDKKVTLDLVVHLTGLFGVLLAVVIFLLILFERIGLIGWGRPEGLFLAVAMFIAACLVALMVFDRGIRPFASILEKLKRMSAGEDIFTFDEEREQTRVTEFLELADDLDGMNKYVRVIRAEAMAETQRQTQFISDVAHELRTPLTAMRGAAETLLDDDIPAEDRYHFCENIMSECNRLTRLANDLMTLQRIEGDEDLVIKRVDLRDVVDRVADILDPLMEDREVELTVGGEAPDVLGDPDRLQQVVVNLVENASRFAGRGDDPKGRVHVELSGVKQHSVISVMDNGPGFGDIDPARLFDRFYRGDFSRARAHGGTGLGLAIVKAIVTSHDGTVEALNLPNGGACFIVAIPSLPPVEGIQDEMVVPAAKA